MYSMSPPPHDRGFTIWMDGWVDAVLGRRRLDLFKGVGGGEEVGRVCRVSKGGWLFVCNTLDEEGFACRD